MGYPRKEVVMRFAFIDIDGTLIDKDDNHRPYIPELIDGLLDLGFHIVLWSAGGNKYAESKWNMICNKIAWETEKEHHSKVTDFMWKMDWQETALIGEKLFIDDQWSLLEPMAEKGYATMLVSFYEESLMPNDTELREALGFARTVFPKE